MSASALEQIVKRFSFIPPLGEAVQDWLGGELKAKPVAQAKEVLNGRWLGHPLHPVLTDLPIGAFSGATLLQLADRGDGGGLGDAADLLLATGCLAGVGAALSGVADWQDKYGPERELGTAHGLVNSAALLLFGGALGLRRLGARRLGLGLSVLGLGTIAAGSYVGGDLVFRLGSQVNRNAFSEGPKKWRPVADESEVAEGELLGREVAGNKILLTRLEGELCAAGAVCSHAGGPLGENPLQDGQLSCPWHGSHFEMRTGKVVHGPATSDNPVFETRVVEGKVEVRRRD